MNIFPQIFAIILSASLYKVSDDIQETKYLNNFQFIQISTCNDTTFNGHVSKMSKEKKPASLYKIYIDTLGYTDECKIKLFAYIMDNLFSEGLDLDYKHKTTVRDNTITFGEGLESYTPKKPDSTNLIQRNLYETFLEVKKAHGYFYVEKDQTKLDSYTIIVENVLKFGVFKYPAEVEKFLRFKYKKLTREKYNANMDKNGYDW